MRLPPRTIPISLRPKPSYCDSHSSAVCQARHGFGRPRLATVYIVPSVGKPLSWTFSPPRMAHREPPDISPRSPSETHFTRKIRPCTFCRDKGRNNNE